ncbi:MAG TPA: hypothetical protein VKS80_02590 [Trinickia sp.]|nr:hypothetical protein [Trinickia sp.]
MAGLGRVTVSLRRSIMWHFLWMAMGAAASTAIAMAAAQRRARPLRVSMHAS